MVNPYEQDLDRNAANHQPLTPLTYLERAAKTYPDHIAIIHGRQRISYRDFWSRSLKLASALQRRGIPSELLYFPDENHWVLKPANSIQWYDTVIGWLNRWTRQ